MLVIATTISVIVLTLIFVAAVAVRRRHFLFQESEKTQISWQHPPKFVSLFAPDTKILAEIEATRRRREATEERDRMLAWASLVDFSCLAEMPATENKKISNNALEILTDRAAADEEIGALVQFVLAHDKLDVTQKIINKFHLVWQSSPNLEKTIKLFDLAIRSENAELFQRVFTEAEQFIKTDKLSDLTAGELGRLASSHFWLLSPNARMSGAGFWLKQKLLHN